MKPEIKKRLIDLISTHKMDHYYEALELSKEVQIDYSKSVADIFTIFDGIKDEQQKHQFFIESNFFKHLIVDQHLVLPNVSWTEINPLVFNYPEIEELNLMTNNIVEIPPSIRKLKNLRRLRINNNQLTTLPHEIGFLTHLHYLELWGNPILEFPEEILQMKNLQTIRLEGLGDKHTAMRRFAAWSDHMSEEQKVATLNGGIKIRPRAFSNREIDAHYDMN